MVNEVKNTDIFVFRILSYQNVHTFTNKPVYTCQLDHTKDNHKNGTYCLRAWHGGIMVRV